MRTPMIAGNWKMNLGRVDGALAFVRQIRYPLNQVDGIDHVLCPPFTVLSAVAESLSSTRIGLGAQTMHWQDSGAYTGEISPSMLQNLCQYVILGHSERRTGTAFHPTLNEQLAGIGNEAVNRKVAAALSHGITPIICVGENLVQNQAGITHPFVGDQVRSALTGISAEKVAECLIAYEPIWAIGTGKAATPAEANRVIGLTVRGAVAEMYGESVAQAVRVLYGGSVNLDNITSFVGMPEIDGALVGGASLKPDFVELVKRARDVYR